MKKSSILVKHALGENEANLYLCCCLKHGYFKPKCHNLHNFQLIIGSAQKNLQKQASEYSF